MQPQSNVPEDAPPVPIPRPMPSHGLWPRLWQHGLMFGLGMCVLLMGQSLWKLTQPPSPLSQTSGSLDLNHADASLLKQLPGVGPQLADRIVEHRSKHGPFGSVEELKKVNGIGEATVERLRVHLVVSGTATPSQSREMQPLRSGPKSTPGNPIDLNKATAQELQTLPGIGPTLAQRIVEDRESKGDFATVNDLSRIKGIKAKTIEKIAPFVFVKKDEPTL
jgi:competence protein ComEA